jgi:hypothetical protein
MPRSVVVSVGILWGRPGRRTCGIFVGLANASSGLRSPPAPESAKPWYQAASGASRRPVPLAGTGYIRRFRGTVGSDAKRDSAFPILSTRRVFGSGGRRGTPVPTGQWKEIKRLGQPTRRAVEWLQPFNVRNDRYHELRSALADIRDLNNIDKHRELHLGQKYVMAVPALSFPAELGFSQHPAFGVVGCPEASGQSIH